MSEAGRLTGKYGTTLGRTTHKRAGIDVHRSLTLTPADTTIVNGTPCTTIARTLLDLAGVVRERPLERALDQAEILGVLDGRALDVQLERNGTRAAARALRTALDEHAPG
jgi:hypothetical protein